MVSSLRMGPTPIHRTSIFQIGTAYQSNCSLDLRRTMWTWATSIILCLLPDIRKSPKVLWQSPTRPEKSRHQRDRQTSTPKIHGMCRSGVTAPFTVHAALTFTIHKPASESSGMMINLAQGGCFKSAEDAGYTSMGRSPMVGRCNRVRGLKARPISSDHDRSVPRGSYRTVAWAN